MSGGRDHNHPVYTYRLQYSVFEQLVRSLILHWLPTGPSVHLQERLCWLFLPDEFIVKEEKPGHELEFEREKQLYIDHPSWWHVHTPMYFGHGFCLSRCREAIVLGLANGKTLYDMPDDDKKHALEKLRTTYARISADGVIHGDPQLEHAYIFEDGAMLIDWGHAKTVSPERAKQINSLDLIDLENDLKLMEH